VLLATSIKNDVAELSDINKVDTTELKILELLTRAVPKKKLAVDSTLIFSTTDLTHDDSAPTRSMPSIHAQ